MSESECECCVNSLRLRSCKLRQLRHFSHPIVNLVLIAREIIPASSMLPQVHHTQGILGPQYTTKLKAMLSLGTSFIVFIKHVSFFMIMVSTSVTKLAYAQTKCSYYKKKESLKPVLVPVDVALEERTIRVPRRFRPADRLYSELSFRYQ